MKREIKFRAWEPMSEMGRPGNMSYDQEFCHSQIRSNDGIEIMQFTGLKDKNGKDMYEGDIIQLGTHKSLRAEVRFHEGCFILYWVNGSPRRNVIDSESETIWGNAHITLKVIGNIFENPELLEGEKK